MNRSNLFFHVETLQMVHVSLTLAFGVAVEAVHGSLLPSGELVLAKCLAGDWVEYVASLARQAFEVVGHVSVRYVGVRVARIRLRLLFLPAWIQKLDYNGSR